MGCQGMGFSPTTDTFAVYFECFLSVVFLDSFAELFVVIISLICVAYQLVWIIPYTVIGKKQVK